jgi:hypothetical protein
VRFSHTQNGHAVWLWRCDDGNLIFAAAAAVRNGHIKSCGCLQREARTKHGRTGTPEYRSWDAMIQRCTNPKHMSWRNYGGRGITICDRWNPKRGGSFEKFFTDMGPRPPGTTLDRIDNDGNYKPPPDCRWATRRQQRANMRQQAANKRKLSPADVHVIRNVRKLSLTRLAGLFGVSISTIHRARATESRSAK